MARGKRRRGGNPVPIGKLIQDVIARRGVGGSLQLKAVTDAWSAIAGGPLLLRARVKGLRGGTVTIETDSSSLAYELHGFSGADLLKRLQQEPGAAFVTRLRFTVGAGSHGK